MAEPGNDRLIFEMGLYKAAFPRDLLYSEIHFWFQPRENSTRVGLSSYAMRLLGDLFRLEWKVYVGESVQPEQCLGEVESTKASAEVYTPMSGKIIDINSAAVDDPSQVSLDPYEHWLLEFEGRPEKFLSSQQYMEFLAADWEVTIKLLKGQA